MLAYTKHPHNFFEPAMNEKGDSHDPLVCAEGYSEVFHTVCSNSEGQEMCVRDLPS